MAGIWPDSDGGGYKNIIIQPAIVGDLSWVSAHHDSPYGRVICNWEKRENLLEMEIVIPPNVSAEVYLPTLDASEITEDKVPVSKVDDILFLRQEKGNTICKIGSGIYHFKCKINR